MQFLSPASHLKLCRNSLMILKQNMYRVSQEKLLFVVFFAILEVLSRPLTAHGLRCRSVQNTVKHTLYVWRDHFEHTHPLEFIDLGMLERKESYVKVAEDS